MFGFSVEWFENVGVYKELKSFDIDEINKLLSQESLNDKIKTVLKKMIEKSKKAEQEILFFHLSNKNFNQRLITESISLTKG